MKLKFEMRCRRDGDGVVEVFVVRALSVVAEVMFYWNELGWVGRGAG